MILIASIATVGSVGFLAYAHKRKWFFLSEVDAQRYEREKPLFK